MLFRLIKRISEAERGKLIGVLVGLIFILLLSASGIARLLTDYWWFNSVDFGNVWSSILVTQVVLAAVFIVASTALVGLNLYLAQKIAPTSLVSEFSDYLTKRFTEILEQSRLLVIGGISLLVGVPAGLQAAGEWQSWMLFTNGQSWGVEEPILNTDAGFYVFDLPFYTFVNDWLFTGLIVTLLLTLGAYFLGGAFNPALKKMTLVDSPKLKLHLSVLGIAIVLTRAVGYYLDRFELLYSDFGGFRGVMATDFTVRLPGLRLMILIAIAAAVFLLLNIRRKGWGFAVIALGLWGLSHIAILGIFPSVYQRLRVDPVRTTREAEFVDHNIEFTRVAFGLDNIDERSVEYEPGLTRANAEAAQPVFASVPVVDPDRADEEFNSNQTVRGFYTFDSPLDIDRYEIDGELKPVVIAARELDLGDEQANWEDRVVVNTHGYGVAIAAAHEQPENIEGRGLEESQPLDFQISGLGLEETILDPSFDENYSERPQVYFSPNLGGYALIGAERDEIDYQTSDNDSVSTRYNGTGGVDANSLFSRLAFALRFAELDPLISGSLTDESKILLNRDVEQRVAEIAPFLALDSDPYPVVDGGRIFWIVDAYTITDDFPYAAQADTTLAVNKDLSSGYNYVRNSVKVVVDAYNGDVDLYNFDSNDPLLAAWDSAFEGVFKSESEFPESLRPHIRYPKDMFTAQTDMWSAYVIDDPQVFVQGDTSWSVAREPSGAPVGEEESEVNTSLGAMPARYTFNRVPVGEGGEAEPDTEFVLQRYFAPRNRDGDRAKHLTAVMMARSDGDNYGDLVLVRVPTGQVQTPDIVDTEIRKLASLTEYQKDRLGNKIDFGEMQLVFANENVVYVRPVYAESSGSGNIPELVRVIASTGDTERAMGTTLEEAIEKLVNNGGEEVTPEATTGETPDVLETPSGSDATETTVVTTDSPTSVTELLRSAESLLTQADQAELDGDVESAAELRGRADEALNSALDLLGG